MTSFEPIFVDIDLPERVILDVPAPHVVAKPAPSLHPNDADAIWYRAHARAMTCAPSGAISLWVPENALGHAARPAEPNDDHARLNAQGMGIGYIREVNGGFVVDAALVEAEQFCCAIRITSPEAQARTLITLNPPQGDNYLFLSEKDGLLEWRDDAGTVEVTMPAPGAEMWILAGYDHGKISLSAAKPGAGFGPPQISPEASDALVAALSGPTDLFIGCRSHRKGILKTLGASTVYDVLFWLDTAGTTPEALDKITQACRHAETQRGGI